MSDTLGNFFVLEQARDYLLFFSMVTLLLVIYVLIRNYRATKNFEARIEHFSSLTNDTFARELNRVETSASSYNVKEGSFGALSRILDAYAVSTTGPDGAITYANEEFCKLSGYSKAELIGRRHNMLSSGIHSAEFWQNFWNIIKQDKVWHGQIANMNRRAEIFWLDAFVFPLSLISNATNGYICLASDTTKLQEEVINKGQQLEQVESMLMQSEKMASLGTISAGIAHEINNPVAFISTDIRNIGEYLESLAGIARLMKQDWDPAKYEQFLGKVNVDHIDPEEVDYILDDYPRLIEETSEGIQRIKTIVQDLKAFARKGGDEFLPTDITRCIRSSLNLARNELKYSIRIDKRFLDSLPSVECAESEISQVLLNIIVNAAHAIEGEGTIAIGTEYDNGFVRVRIKDDGCGIDEATRSQIFEPFFTTKSVGRGTGLGLSISHDIIVRHHGTIEVLSELGNGTEFIISLPVQQPATQADSDGLGSTDVDTVMAPAPKCQKKSGQVSPHLVKRVYDSQQSQKHTPPLDGSQWRTR
ncbi:Signal transduction histidine-protein kinase AtoS [BD1-7 clade bacterium]|uniref:histidine kinase n=1 Tax=BD1-7 clade bacterium TaxID=2029982 RepID=A0A5S9QZW6_9GAMM|nr:Signal transduction histidine-protein kinase AtoS [BD1-7 clade bacterium]